MGYRIYDEILGSYIGDGRVYSTCQVEDMACFCIEADKHREYVLAPDTSAKLAYRRKLLAKHGFRCDYTNEAPTLEVTEHEIQNIRQT